MSRVFTKKSCVYNSFFEARKQAGLTLREAARRSGVPTSTIWSWENKGRSNSFESLRAVAQTYGCTLGQMIGMEVLEGKNHE